MTPGEGGSVSVGWDPKEMRTQAITVWEPLRRMQTASELPSADGRAVRLAVDYYLEAHGRHVRVRLVHSGFDDSGSWDDYIDGLDAGWTYFMFNLKYALERHRGVDRRQVSARFRTAARAGEEHPVYGAKGLRVQPPVAGLRPGDACHLSLGGVEVDATVAVHAGRTIAFVVAGVERRATWRRTRGNEGGAPIGRLAVTLRGARDNHGAVAAGTGRPTVGAQRA